MNGLQAVTQNFVAAQTYPGPTPQMGFVGPGALPARQQPQLRRATSATSSAATPPTRRAVPTATPRPRAGTPRPAGASPTGSTSASATRCALGATNLSVPPSLSPALRVDVREDAEQLDRARLLVPDGVDLLRGRQPRRAATPWYGKFLTGRRLGRREHVLQEHRRRGDLVPVEQRHVLDRLHEQQHVHRGGSRRPRAADDRRRQHVDRRRHRARTTTSRSRRSRARRASTCYAVGDRGNAMKSTDGGQTWSWLNTTDGNPIYGLSCPIDDGLLRDRHLRPRPQDDGRRHDLGVADDADHDAGRRGSGLRRAEPVRRADGDLVLLGDDLRRLGPLRRPERPDDPEHRSADHHDDERRHDLDAPDEQRRRRGTTCTGSRASPGTTDLHRGRPRRADRHHDRPRRPGRRRRRTRPTC